MWNHGENARNVENGVEMQDNAGNVGYGVGMQRIGAETWGITVGMRGREVK